MIAPSVIVFPQDSSAAVFLNGEPILRRMTRFGKGDIRPALFDLAPGMTLVAAYVGSTMFEQYKISLAVLRVQLLISF